MNFDLSEEQELLQSTVGDFLTKECPPDRLRAIFDADEPFDRGLWKGLLELGVGGIAVPESYGGAGLELQGPAEVLDRAPLIPQLGVDVR